MVKCFVSNPHLMPFHLSSSQVDPSHSTAGLTVALMRDYLYTRTLQTFLCRSPIKLEQISGMGDSCKWEEKVILSDPWHPWFKQGDQRLLSNCLSFIYVNQINWTLILRPLPFFFFFFYCPHNKCHCITERIHYSPRDDPSLPLSCHLWCDIAALLSLISGPSE